METLLATALGVMTGVGVASVHPLVNPGRIIAVLAGALGGWLGSLWWTDDFAERFAGHSYAGAAVAGAIGGAGLALIVGIGLTVWRRTRQ
ncbi:hypothetical protein [Demequina sp. NBRC 110051]|uniref:hypothetical protein n=1 Tax=Demequina sp. NBRC 110051 TaxID=1570340 RepID=UPI0009FC4062|nr:hypothetical protein [Demequina sp. NBRC 110051]